MIDERVDSFLASHGDLLVCDLDDREFLMHRDHKYIKKFWEKGKWVYEYAQDKATSARKSVSQFVENLIKPKPSAESSPSRQLIDPSYKKYRDTFNDNAVKVIDIVKQKNASNEQNLSRQNQIQSKGFGVIADILGRPRATAAYALSDAQNLEILYNKDKKTYTTPADEIHRNPEKYQIKDKYERSAHAAFQMTDTDLNKCNPNFGDPGTTNNCAKCTAAMELRLRGYDVSAGRMEYGTLTNGMDLWFKNPEHAAGTIADAKRAISKYGPMTSGTVSFTYPMGGGHIVHWTIDANGEFQIQDGQSGLTFGSIDEMIHKYGGDPNGHYVVYRLDNCEPNFAYLSNDAVIRLSVSVDTEKSYIVNQYTRKIAQQFNKK